MSFFQAVNNLMPLPGYYSGRTCIMFDGAASGAAVNAVDVIYFYPFTVYYPLSFTQGIMRCTTGGAASSVKGAIWANSTVSARPLGAPLYKDETGAATTGSSTNITLALGAGTLQPGYYWFGSKYTGTLPSMLALPSTEQRGGFFGGNHNATAAIYQPAFSIADAYANAFPTIAEGAAFSVSAVGVPVFGLTIA